MNSNIAVKRKLRIFKPAEYSYAVLTRETTKDWAKDTELNIICQTLEDAVEKVNSIIENYIKDYCLEEEFQNKFPTVSAHDILNKKGIASGDPVQIINVKSPEDEFNDPDEDGMWGNLRIYIQRMKKTDF